MNDHGLTREQAVLLVDELRELERMAHQALESLKSGHATSGASALWKIKCRANDARRWTDGLLVIPVVSADRPPRARASQRHAVAASLIADEARAHHHDVYPARRARTAA